MRWLLGALIGSCFALIPLAAGCGGTGDDTGTGAKTGTTGTAGSSGTDTCLNSNDCPDGSVCDPKTQTCAAELPCATHSDCGSIAYCSGGTCKENVPGGPCDEDANCVPGEGCTEGFCGCGGALYGAESVPPNVLIVLDRSSSMNEQITGGTKWDIARDAINELLATYGGGVQFGLMLYPGTSLDGNEGADCGPGTVFVDPGPMTAMTIETNLAGAGTTSFGTPTAEALEILIDYPGLEDPQRGNYILLVTDGQSTCDPPVPIVESLLAETPTIKTFVVGFGDGVDPTELEALAQAGGTAMNPPPSYYQAGDAASLASAFSAIAGSVLSCSYVLSEVPPDPSQLFVYVDGKPVPSDPDNGWVYDPDTNQITFFGETCDALKSQAKELLISYGCPIVEPP